MSRIVYINGIWCLERDAKISVFDRGFLFGDAVYEVTAVVDGHLIAYAGHASRLRRSLEELAIPAPVDDEALLDLHCEIVARNRVDEGLVYLQISRGSDDRDFVCRRDLYPTLVMFTQARPLLSDLRAERGISVISVLDKRWGRRDIKTVQLLHSSMMKTEARARGVDDVILYEDGFVTEASSANVFIVTPEHVLITRDLSPALLPGVTRASVLKMASAAGVAVNERAFTLEEARSSSECFITSATTFVLPVVRFDGQPIRDGQPGSLTRYLRDRYIETEVRPTRAGL